MSTKDLNVVIVTTEIVPFSKVGGLADVMGALPDELEKIGCEVSIFTPLYASIDRRMFDIRREKRVPQLEVSVAGRTERFTVYSALKPGTWIRTYFISSERLYTRDGIYTVPGTGEAFVDEDERTIFFNKAVIEAVKACGLRPDVIHCNDFHTGLIPAYLELEQSGNEHFQKTGTVFSVHNLAYQGIFGRDFLAKAGFDAALFAPGSPFEFWGKVNVMKIGLSFAGFVSTVSETYAEEITTTDEYGYGLEGVLRSRGKDLVGILNGIDPDVWDPGSDELIPHHFSRTDMGGKDGNRQRLLEEFGLPAGSSAPVIGMVSRLVDQKGFDILGEAFDDIMKLDVTFIILGTGQHKYHELYSELARTYPERLGLKLDFDNRLAHLIEAGSDFFLMPSRYEPCGLNQMYSLRYGTIPIVRATGGLKDTISNLSRNGTRGNGFLFTQYAPKDLHAAVAKAVDFYGNREALSRVRERIMREDHSWRTSAKAYRKLYLKAKGRVGMGLTNR